VQHTCGCARVGPRRRMPGQTTQHYRSSLSRSADPLDAGRGERSLPHKRQAAALHIFTRAANPHRMGGLVARNQLLETPRDAPQSREVPAGADRCVALGGGPRRWRVYSVWRRRQIPLESPIWHHRGSSGAKVHRIGDSVGPDGARWGPPNANREPTEHPIRSGTSRDPLEFEAGSETHSARY